MADPAADTISHVPARDIPTPGFLSDVARSYLLPQPGPAAYRRER